MLNPRTPKTSLLLLLALAAACVAEPDYLAPSSSVARSSHALGAAGCLPGVSGYEPLATPDPNRAKYPISGYWMHADDVSLGDCRWRKRINQAYSVGADTVIGYVHLDAARSVDPGDGSNWNYVPSDCKEAGVNCFDAAEAALKAADSSNYISRIYRQTYASNVRDMDVLQNALDVRFSATTSGNEYIRILVPASDIDKRGLDAAWKYSPASTPGIGYEYYLFLLRVQTADGLGILLDEAEALGMSVFINSIKSMPSAEEYEDDPQEIEVLKELIRRVFQSYNYMHAAGGTHADELQGVYQDREIYALGTAPFASGGTMMQSETVRNVYRESHWLYKAKLTHVTNPKIMISPYWKTVTSTGEDVLDKVEYGMDILARESALSIDVIAPQSGHGDSRVPMIWKDAESGLIDDYDLARLCYEQNEALFYSGGQFENGVDPSNPQYIQELNEELACLGGNWFDDTLSGPKPTNAQRFHATMWELYDRARSSVESANSATGRSVDLWANIEVFTPRWPRFYVRSLLDDGNPSNDPPFCGFADPLLNKPNAGKIQAVTKGRTDRAIAHAGHAPSKLIAWQFLNLADNAIGTCAPPLEPNYAHASLHTEMLERIGQPIVMRGWISNGGRVYFYGYNLAGSSYRLQAWTQSQGWHWLSGCGSGWTPSPGPWDPADISPSWKMPEDVRYSYSTGPQSCFDAVKNLPAGSLVKVHVSNNGYENNSWHRFAIEK